MTGSAPFAAAAAAVMVPERPLPRLLTPVPPPARDRPADLTEAAMEVEDQAWRRAVLSDDRREGIAAWTEKRDPRWPGA